jgi:hypothetical protein
MICFELSRNGKRMATAGIPGLAVLTATFTWVRRRLKPGSTAIEEDLKVHLGGLSSNDPSDSYHLAWFDRGAKVGDLFTVRILEGDRVDRPRSRTPREDEGASGKKRIAYIERIIAAHQRGLKTARLELRRAKRLAAKR